MWRCAIADNEVSGFRRLPLHAAAAPPLMAAQWAGVPLVWGGAASDGDAPPQVAEALRHLDELARTGGWLAAGDLRRRTDRCMAELAGLDQDTPEKRLRAAAVRAYAEADRLAEAVVARRADESKARRLAAELRYAATLPMRAHEILKRRPADNEDKRQWRLTDAARTRDVLNELAYQLGGFAAGVAPGRIEDVPKRFLVMRLAEAFAVLTGESPHWAQRQTPSPWWQFVSAALRAVAFPTGDQGLDRTLRAIGRMPEARDAIADLAQRSRAATAPLDARDLASWGVLIDYGLPMPWARDADDSVNLCQPGSARKRGPTRRY